MKKALIFLLLIAGIYTANAQDYFKTTTTTATTQLAQDDGNQYIGIGMTGPQLVGNIAGVTVTNFNQPTIPTICMQVLNQIPSTSTNNTAASTVGFGVGRMNPANFPNGIGDLIVDQDGLVGVGGFPALWGNSNINAHFYITDQNGDGYPLFAAYTYANNPGMIIDQNGMVGIGTPSPAAMLSIAIGGVLDDYALASSTTSLLITKTWSPSFGGPETRTDMIVTGSGYVGIGTASPAYPLDVYGNAKLENTIDVVGNATFESSALVGNTLTVGSHTTNSDAGTLTIDAAGLGSYSYAATIQVSDPTVKAFAINQQCQTSGCTGTTDKFVILADGRTAIGDFTSVVSPALPNGWTSSNTGGYMLYVNGGVLASKYKCSLSSDATNWSDYVFDKDYKLLDLNQVKEYIAKNHHLPDVPSTDDVICDGIDLGSMDATLLKKIEELTLYVLQLKKDNETMKAQLSTIIK